tara:strand:+ start:3053 stop:3220 length:168 start_codon:yes stop_codon:yes gene_type:complete
MTRITVKVKVEIEEEIEIEVETDLMHESIEEYMDGVVSNLQDHICLEDYAVWEMK